MGESLAENKAVFEKAVRNMETLKETQVVKEVELKGLKERRDLIKEKLKEKGISAENVPELLGMITEAFNSLSKATDELTQEVLGFKKTLDDLENGG